MNGRNSWTAPTRRHRKSATVMTRPHHRAVSLRSAFSETILLTASSCAFNSWSEQLVDSVRRRKRQQTHPLSCWPHSAAAAPARPRPMAAGPAWPPESRGFERFELAGERALTSPRTAAAPRACRCQLRRAAASWFPGRYMQPLLHSIVTVLRAASGAKESLRTCV